RSAVLSPMQGDGLCTRWPCQSIERAFHLVQRAEQRPRMPREQRRHSNANRWSKLLQRRKGRRRGRRVTDRERVSRFCRLQFRFVVADLHVEKGQFRAIAKARTHLRADS